MLQNNDRHLLNTCITKVSHFLGPLPPVEHNVVYGMVENLYQIGPSLQRLQTKTLQYKKDKRYDFDKGPIQR